jgi:tRNA modification GTPase
VADVFPLVACLTPPGTAAVATLAVRGPGAWPLVRELFVPLSSTQPLPAEPVPGRFRLGRLGQALADEVVLSVKRSGPEPSLEIHCHGGREVVRLLLEMLEGKGARVCTWQELERRTADDPLQALALAALPQAPTVRTAAILLDQYHGVFRRAIDAARTALQEDRRDEAGRLLAELAGRAGVGRHLVAPWRVTVAGAPNVGKSSLVNALAGYRRSVVSATPGTTRDVVTTLLALDGWPVELADTAGLRPDPGAVEAAGIEQARAAAAAADLCLWVLDATAPPVWPAFALPLLRLVVNKVDLPAAWDLGEAGEALHVSAKTGDGLPALCDAVAGWLVPAPPPPGAAVPFTPTLCERVETARRHLAVGEVREVEESLQAMSL